MLFANILVSLMLSSVWAPGLMAAPAVNIPQDSQQPSPPKAEPTPAQQTEAKPAEPASQQSMPAVKPPEAERATTPKSAPAKKPATRKVRKRKHPVPANGVPKTVVRNGGTSEPKVELSPGVPQQQAMQEKETISQLLAITDGNLQKVSSRQLDAGQEETVRQIRNYTEQAKTAEKQGDIQRAQNLASKARQLSDDLVKPR